MQDDEERLEEELANEIRATERSAYWEMTL